MKQVLFIKRYMTFTSTEEFKIYDSHQIARITLDAGQYVYEHKDFDNEIIFTDDGVTLTPSDYRFMTDQDVTNLFWRLDSLITNIQALNTQEETSGSEEREELNNLIVYLDQLHTLLEDYIKTAESKLAYLDQEVKEASSPTFAGLTVGTLNALTLLGYLNQSVKTTDSPTFADATIASKLLSTYLGYLDQSVKEASTPTFAGVKTDNQIFKQKLITMGDWDMSTDFYKDFAHGLTLSKIVSVTGVVIKDDGTKFTIDSKEGTTSGVYFNYINGTNIRVDVNTDFRTSDYNDSSFNRGYIVITYIP